MFSKKERILHRPKLDNAVLYINGDLSGIGYDNVGHFT